ncbi:MAG: UbiX family flavin prenyltransferase [Gemmatimonadota bacterium]
MSALLGMGPSGSLPSVRTVLGISGASGSAFAIELARRLPGDVYAVLSRWGQHVLRQETDLGREDLERLVTRLFTDTDLSAPLASGSNDWDAMVVLPCSTSTVGKIASGIADSLLTRAAAVTLKEGRRLVLCPRETPLSAVTLRQLAALAGDGVTIMPVSPGWYGRPATVDDLVEDFVGRVLQVLGVEVAGGWRASELEDGIRELPRERIPEA